MTKIKCKHCRETIEGDKKGTFITCKCGKCAIDETEYGCRLIGNIGDYELMKLQENYDRIYNENCKLREEHNINDISLLDDNYQLMLRIDKAIEWVENNKYYFPEPTELLKILKGVSE